ncbi:MAG: HepT-like ribonuclease domain-containing protein [Rhizomicrobium sp.]
MPSDSERRRLEHICQNIAYIREFIAGRSFDAFAADRLTFYAVMRALAIISEASRHLGADIQARHRHIDWIAVRDAGNVYRHGYDVITEERVWDTVTKHLPILEQAAVSELSG